MNIRVQIEVREIKYDRLINFVGSLIYVSPTADGILSRGPYLVTINREGKILLCGEKTTIEAETIRLSKFWIEV